MLAALVFVSVLGARAGAQESPTAVPVAGGEDPPQTLSIGDVQVTADASGGHTFLFSVKNVGNSYTDGYGVNFGIISQ